ncbi:MAG: MarR family transcriptional regulator [Candidatus Saccharibacteria bacterium]|nr:MarR family transcriptional regulator [Microbacteriaceae bacterium]
MSPDPDHVAKTQDEWKRERPDLDVSPTRVIGRLHRLAAHLTDELVVVYNRHGLGEGEFDVLATLRRAGPPFERAPGELAVNTMVTTGAMTKRIDRLIQAGLVTRRESITDGRRRVIGLSPQGRELIDAAFTEHMSNERRLVEMLSSSEREQLEVILLTWISRFE